MKNQSKIQNPKSKIAIVGAGPAGASLAIRLANVDFDVILIERERFPRQKLCGEFVSPECFEHFRALGVLDEMLSVGGDRITETIFYEPNGKNVTIPTEWFGGDVQGALGISRAEMDFRLLEKAKKIGVKVLEETSAVDLLMENGEVCGVKVKNQSGETSEITADFTIDATGRAGVLGKFLRRKAANTKLIQNSKSKIQNRLVGFKAHLKNISMNKGVCEIYFFRGGYGGLNYVEEGFGNHCFLIKAEVVKEFNGNADEIVKNVVFQNKRAFETLKDAETVYDWLAVSVDEFGRKDLSPAPRLLTVGDASAFIDPFTGSGMLMALEGAEILAKIITEKSFASQQISAEYKILHKQKFQTRLRICSIMRRAAFVPSFAKFAISALSLSAKARELLARSTRKTFPVSELEK
jgi:flavin-dependent dehydrogenase